MKHHKVHQRRFLDKTMTVVGIIALIVTAICALSSCNRYNGCPSHRGMNGYSFNKPRNTQYVTILKWHTDKRGLTSVQWRDNNGRISALDYATRDELREEGLVK